MINATVKQNIQDRIEARAAKKRNSANVFITDIKKRKTNTA